MQSPHAVADFQLRVFGRILVICNPYLFVENKKTILERNSFTPKTSNCLGSYICRKFAICAFLAITTYFCFYKAKHGSQTMSAGVLFSLTIKEMMRITISMVKIMLPVKPLTPPVNISFLLKISSLSHSCLLSFRI